MGPEQHEDDLAQQSRLPKPGGLIRKAREQRGLTLEALSERTRLTEAVLTDLQSDNFEALGQPVYARGYYRKCAEVLGLNGEALVEAYEQHSGTESPIPVIEQRPSIAYREGPGRLALIATLGLMAIVFGLSGLWLWDEEPALTQSTDGMASQAEQAPAVDFTKDVSSGELLDSAQAERAQDAASSDANANQTSGDEDAEMAPPMTSDEVATQPDEALPAQDSELSTAGAPKPVDGRQDAVAALSQDRAATAPSKPSAVATKGPELRVEIQGGDAWIEVYARTGERLLYKLLHDGDARDVSGMAPYRLNIGRADNVRLSVNGDSLDFSKQIDAGAKAAFWLDAQGRIYDDQIGDAG